MSGLDEPGEEPFVPDKRNDALWKRWPNMTSLATRIADVVKEELAVHSLPTSEFVKDWGRQEFAEHVAMCRHTIATLDRRTALIRRMAARIEELEKALEPMVDALSKCVPGWEDHVWVDDNHAINMGHLRTAARVHAETGEKEKP